MKRDKKINLNNTAVLLVDVQNSEVDPKLDAEYPEYLKIVQELALPNITKIIEKARGLDVEVIYTVIEALTKDGRDRSLDHKLSNMLYPKGCYESKVIECVSPKNDEIVIPKTSSGVFNSTNMAYVLRNLEIENIIVVGFLTDQCVDMTIRDGADKGFYMICCHDACATRTAQRQKNALEAFGGYCLTLSTSNVLDLLDGKND